jgi:hypothetical protein
MLASFAAVVIVSLLTLLKLKSLGPYRLSPLMDIEKSRKKNLEIATYVGFISLR